MKVCKIVGEKGFQDDSVPEDALLIESKENVKWTLVCD